MSVYIGTRLITRDYPNQLRSASGSPALRKYFLEKSDWNYDTPDLVWWRVHHQSIASFSKSNQQPTLYSQVYLYLATNMRTIEHV